MGSLDALLESLERDAEGEAAGLISAAEQRARTLRAHARAERDRRRAEVMGQVEAEGRRAVAGATAAAARRFRESRLRDRALVLERIFTEAGQQLRATGAEHYRALLPRLMADTIRYLEGTPAVMICRPEIGPLLEAERSGALDVTVETSTEAAAGLLGRSTDGLVVVDNTLPALLRRRQAELMIALAVRLEAG